MNRKLGMDPQGAVARATATAGSAVLFAGATVVIGLSFVLLLVAFRSVLVPRQAGPRGYRWLGVLIDAFVVRKTLVPPSSPS